MIENNEVLGLVFKMIAKQIPEKEREELKKASIKAIPILTKVITISTIILSIAKVLEDKEEDVDQDKQKQG